MEQLRNAWQGVLALFKKKKRQQEEPAPEETAQKQNDASVKDKSLQFFGINKKIVIGTSAVFGGVFLVALISSFFFSPDGKDANKKAAHIEPASQSTATGKSNIPITYDGLAKYNQAAQKPGAATAATTTKPQQIPNGSTGSVNPANSEMQSNTYAPVNSYSQPTYTASPRMTQPVYTPVGVPDYSGVNRRSNDAVSTPSDSQANPIRFSLQGLADLARSVTGNSPAMAASANSNPASTPNTGSIAGGTGNVGAYTPASPNMLIAGAVVPATLISGLNSDLPGQVVAQVRQDVYDSVTGYTLLIPQGSRLIGEYSNRIGTGQNRIGISWSTLILPNGGSYNLGGMMAVDLSGYAGLHDQVDNHSGQVYGSALVTSFLSALGTIASGNTTTTTGTQSYGQLAASGAATNLVNAASKMIEKNLSVQPTIIIRPGMNFDVFVNRSLVFEAY